MLDDLSALERVLFALAGNASLAGVAQLIFQEGRLSGLLGFEPQGFLDAWGPGFFFAMIFAISMDYTVFLLSSAKEHWDRGEAAKGAMVGAGLTAANVKGGLSSWARAGLPVETGPEPRASETKRSR